MDTLHALEQLAWVRGAIAGLVSAAVVDVHACTKFQNWGDLANYDWGKATFRWTIGAATGAATGIGLGNGLS